MGYFWRNTDFRPVAVPGWRAVFFRGGSGWVTHPLAGWVVQDQIECDEERGIELPTGTRRFMAATAGVIDGCVLTVDVSRSFWKVLGPGEPDPTPGDEARDRPYYEDQGLIFGRG